jgi:hypothetical protein
MIGVQRRSQFSDPAARKPLSPRATLRGLMQA